MFRLWKQRVVSTWYREISAAGRPPLTSRRVVPTHRKSNGLPFDNTRCRIGSSSGAEPVLKKFIRQPVICFVIDTFFMINSEARMARPHDGRSGRFGFIN